MDFLIAGIVVATIAWLALRPRFGISQNTFSSRAESALSELGMDFKKLSPDWQQAFTRDRAALWDERGRQSNPYEMACAFYLKILEKHPEIMKEAARQDRALIHAMIKATTWRGEEISSKFADLFTLGVRLHLTEGQLLQYQNTEQA